MAKITRWVISIEKSGLNTFDSFIDILNKYKSYICNYFKDRKNSGFIEGLNNKIKVAKKFMGCSIRIFKWLFFSNYSKLL